MPRPALLAPRYWPTWLMVAPFRVLPFLPWRLQFACGRAIGRTARRFAHRRRAITRKNLELCFPEKSPEERERLLREHFKELGVGLMETALGWFAPDWRLRQRMRIEGLEHLKRAHEAGRGVILLTAHFTTLEVGGRMLAMKHRVMAVYHPHKNPVIDHLMTSRRGMRTTGIIRRGDLRAMLTSLRQNAAIWYAPDQAYVRKGWVAAPFFGAPAPTNTATSRIALSTGAAVVPFFVKRTREGYYHVRVLAPLERFPSGDHEADAARVNAVLEDGIREAPAQYLWSHDRFKLFRRPVVGTGPRGGAAEAKHD